MAKFDTKSIRNIALLGHGGSGKTSLAESMLYIAGATDRLGKVGDGNTVCDYDAEEIKRGFTLSASVANIEWKGIKINILDTPGYLDFAGEVNQALRVAGSAVITVDAKAGVEVGTELAWDSATAYGVPKVFFVNKCDETEANFDRVFKELDYKFGRTVCPVFVPVGDGKDITMLDLIAMKAYKYDYRGKRTEVPVLDEYMDVVSQYREALNEALAGTSDELMEKYFNGEEITKEEATEALHQGIIDGTITPVYCGSATNVFGVIAMLDAISESFPRFTAKKNERVADGTLLPIDVEGDPAIFVFKTVADQFVGKMSFFKVMSGTVKRDMVLKNNVTGVNEKMAHLYVLCGKNQTEVDELACGDIGMIAKLSDTNTNDTLALSSDVKYLPIHYPKPYYTQSMAPAAKGDEGKISQGIAKLLEEDLTLAYENNAETKQMLISGLGDMHLAVLVAKLKARFGVNIVLGEPKIAYREKITKRVQVEGKHKKQSGGSGQYGHVKITFAPGEAEGLTFTESVVGGAVPKNYFPAVEKGLLEAMQKGVAGFPVIHLAADLFDGSYHDVDSNEISFKLAANLAYKECLKQASPVILEPVGDLTIVVPDSLVGDIMGDINKRRGSVMGMDPCEKQGYTMIKAIAPKSELVEYPIVLRAMTQGRGYFDFEVTGYEVVPGNISAKIVEAYKNSQES